MGLLFAIAIACLLCIFGFSLQASGRLSLKMTPEHRLHINSENTPDVKMLCVLRDEAGQPVPLEGCEYRDNYGQYTMQFNEGHASPNYTRSSGLTGKYQGRGLELGECGLAFGGYKNGFIHVLGCRVRPLGGIWRTAAMMLDVDEWKPMQYHLEPPGVMLAMKGSNVTLQGKAEHVLDWCLFSLPPADKTIRLEFNSGPASANHSLGRYHGAGVSNKECGTTLLNVQPERSGFVRGEVFSESPGSSSSDFIELIIMSAPESPPLLTVLTPRVLQPGDFLEATCLVENSRPAANITWHLGDVELRSGITEDGDLDSTWRWNHDPQTVQTRLRLRLDSSHNSKKLLCRAGHLALPSGFQNSTSVDIRVIASTNPCSPNTCGNHTVCQANGELRDCSCRRPYIGDPPHCRLECVVNTDCPWYRSCVVSRCVDLCLPGSCGQDATCSVESHAAVCKCPAGLIGDPYERCKEEECGRRQVNPQLIAGGHKANYGEFPWHAGIYQLKSLVDNTTRYEQICGGTLIKANIVITAAHCVYDQGYNRVNPKENYGVALGKVLRDWYADLAIDDVQRMDVDNILVHRDFRGDEYDYRYDIAILKLSSTAVMTSRVNVACVDWANTFGHFQLATGNIGTITGFGKTNGGSAASADLQWIELPWVDVDTCRAATGLKQRKYLSSDKFCAGYVNRNMSVCAGDSGGGLLFLNTTSDRFYLRGVASTSLVYTTQKLLCYSNHYTLFTKLSDFVGWIRTYTPEQ